MGAIPLGAIPRWAQFRGRNSVMGAIPLGAIPCGRNPVGAIPLGAIPMEPCNTYIDLIFILIQLLHSFELKDVYTNIFLLNMVNFTLFFSDKYSILSGSDFGP